jgi:hypothetical protein
MQRTISFIGIMVLAGIFGWTGSAAANGGMMGSGMMGGGSGYGQGMWNLFQGYANGMDRNGENYHTQSRAERLQQAQDRFFDTTHRLRADIKERQARLKEEQDQRSPDQ